MTRIGNMRGHAVQQQKNALALSVLSTASSSLEGKKCLALIQKKIYECKALVFGNNIFQCITIESTIPGGDK